MNIDWSKYDDSVRRFSFEGDKKIAKVVHVYDGDTIRVVFPVHKTFYKWTCRLVNVDTPEIRTRCKLQKQYGYKVRDALREKILNKIVLIECGEFDKYGRLLVNIYDDVDFKPIQTNTTSETNETNETSETNETNENVEADLTNVQSINEWLIENNYAFYYDGGTKSDWSIFLKENIDLFNLE